MLAYEINKVSDKKEYKFNFFQQQRYYLPLQPLLSLNYCTDLKFDIVLAPSSGFF